MRTWAAAWCGRHTTASQNTQAASQTASSLTGAILFAATEVSAWSEDLGGGVVRQTVMTPHARAVDGTATAVDLSHGQRPPVRNSMQAQVPCGLAVYFSNAFGLAVPAVACPMASAPGAH